MSKTIILITISLLLINSCSSIGKLNKEDLKVKELSYGTCSTEMVQMKSLQSSPSGTHIGGGKKLNIIEKIDTILIEEGNQFGVEYIIQAPKNRNITVKTIWTYPDGMKDLTGQILKRTEYYVKKRTNNYTYSNYTLPGREHAMPGDWILEIFYSDRRIYKKVFHLK